MNESACSLENCDCRRLGKSMLRNVEYIMNAVLLLLWQHCW